MPRWARDSKLKNGAWSEGLRRDGVGPYDGFVLRKGKAVSI